MIFTLIRTVFVESYTTLALSQQRALEVGVKAKKQGRTQDSIVGVTRRKIVDAK